jgi:ribonuclease HI/uncharacterized C2H2 Zn-finger protein
MSTHQCTICQKVCKSAQGLIQHMEMKHGGHVVHQGVSSWEAARRQKGELTTGTASHETLYQIDYSDYDAHADVWRCSMPGCGKIFRNQNGYECHLKSGVHEAKLYQCSCGKQYRRLADLNAHAESGTCGAASALRASRQVRTFMHDAQQSQLMIADGSVRQQHFEGTLHFDGGARPNPGTGGWGYVLRDDCGYIVEREGGSAGNGVTTSNQAEYAGLIAGLSAAERQGIRRLQVNGDSELVICQMSGGYQVHSSKLLPYYKLAKEVQSRFLHVSFQHVRREENSEADALARQAIDRELCRPCSAYGY